MIRFLRFEAIQKGPQGFLEYLNTVQSNLVEKSVIPRNLVLAPISFDGNS